MKLRYLCATTLSLALVACTQGSPVQQTGPQAITTAQNNAKLANLTVAKPKSKLSGLGLIDQLKLKEPGLTLLKKPVLNYSGTVIQSAAGKESLRVQLPIKSDFGVQFADYGTLATFKVWVTGSGISGQINQDGGGALDATGETLTATVSDIPAADGEIRFVTAQGYDADGNALPAFKAQGYYFSQSGTTEVTLNMGRQYSLTAQILQYLYTSAHARFVEVDPDALQTMVEELLGYDAATDTFQYQPNMFDAQAIADLIPKPGTVPTAADAATAGMMDNSTVRINFKTPGGDDFGESVQVIIDDPSSEPTQVLRTWNSDYDLDVDNVAPGDWKVYIYDLDGNLLGQTTVSVDGSGNMMYPAQTSFTLDVWEMQSETFAVDTEYGRPVAESVIMMANPVDFANVMISPSTDLTGSGNDPEIEIPPGNWTMYALDTSYNVLAQTDFSDTNSGNFAQDDDPLILPHTVEEKLGQFSADNNTTSTYADVAMNDDASFVAVWENNSNEGNGTSGIYARMFKRNGDPVASEFHVNSTTSYNQTRPAVAVDPDGGNFVVVWESQNGDNSGYGVFGAVYNSSGGVVRSEFQINTVTTDSQRYPDVAMNHNGNFVVVWDSEQGGIDSEVYARRFDSSGNPMDGSEFNVSEISSIGDQRFARVALNDNDDFVVTYESENAANDYFNIYARVYNSAAGTITSEFLVNSITTYNQVNSSVAMDDAGNFVAVWDSAATNNGDDMKGTFAALFQQDGTAIRSEFLVNASFTLGDQVQPDVSMDMEGKFVVAWQSYENSGSDFGIYAQSYDSGGWPVGSEFHVSTNTTGDQIYPAVSMNDDGDFAIFWHDSVTGHVNGQLYAPDGMAR